jgi:hypothetical protein
LIFGYFSIKLARLPAGKAGLWREKSTEQFICHHYGDLIYVFVDIFYKYSTANAVMSFNFSNVTEHLLNKKTISFPT